MRRERSGILIGGLAFVCGLVGACAASVQMPDDAAAGRDLACAPSPDAAVPSPDAAVPADLAAPDADLAAADLVPALDALAPPDLAPPVDLTPIPDLVLGPDATPFNYRWEIEGGACPPSPKVPGSKAAGAPCQLAGECKGACCKCPTSGKTFWANACVSQQCADAAATCHVTLLYEPTLCP